MTQDPQSPSDESLRTAILARFAADDCKAYPSVRVGVLNGIAHLAGIVTSLEDYVSAAELAGSVSGVRGVVNRLEAPGAPKPSRRIDLNLQTEDQRKTQGDAK